MPDTLIAPSLPRRMACWLYEGMLLFAVVFVAGWLFDFNPRTPLFVSLALIVPLLVGTMLVARSTRQEQRLPAFAEEHA